MPDARAPSHGNGRVRSRGLFSHRHNTFPPRLLLFSYFNKFFCFVFLFAMAFKIVFFSQSMRSNKKIEKTLHHLVAAAAKPPIRVIKCNGPLACSHLLSGDSGKSDAIMKATLGWFIFLISSSWLAGLTLLTVTGVLRQRSGIYN